MALRLRTCQEQRIHACQRHLLALFILGIRERQRRQLRHGDVIVPHLRRHIGWWWRWPCLHLFDWLCRAWALPWHALLPCSAALGCGLAFTFTPCLCILLNFFPSGWCPFSTRLSLHWCWVPGLSFFLLRAFYCRIALAQLSSLSPSLSLMQLLFAMRCFWLLCPHQLLCISCMLLFCCCHGFMRGCFSLACVQHLRIGAQHRGAEKVRPTAGTRAGIVTACSCIICGCSGYSMCCMCCMLQIGHLRC